MLFGYFNLVLHLSRMYTEALLVLHECEYAEGGGYLMSTTSRVIHQLSAEMRLLEMSGIVDIRGTSNSQL